MSKLTDQARKRADELRQAQDLKLGERLRESGFGKVLASAKDYAIGGKGIMAVIVVILGILAALFLDKCNNGSTKMSFPDTLSDAYGPIIVIDSNKAYWISRDSLEVK